MPDKERLIEQSWLSYRESVIPKDAGSVQLQECRRAFYAGAQGLFTIFMMVFDPRHDVTDGDLATMSSIEAELKRYVAKVKAGLA